MKLAGPALTPFPRRGLSSGPSVVVGGRKRPPWARVRVPGGAPRLPGFVYSHFTTLPQDECNGDADFVTLRPPEGAPPDGGSRAFSYAKP